MTETERDDYKIYTVKCFVDNYLLRWTTGSDFEGGYNGKSEEKISKIKAELKEKVVITELGKSSVLCEIPEYDFERLTIGGNEKLSRLGSIFIYRVNGSVPLDLAKERVIERLNKIDPMLVFEETHEFYNDGELLLIITRRNDREVDIEQDTWVNLVDIVKKGKSMTNLKNSHYGWIYWHSKTRFISIDKKLYDLFKSFGLKEKRCKGCGERILGNDEVCPLCFHKFLTCSYCGEQVLAENGKVVRGEFFCNKCADLPRCKGCGRPIVSGEGFLCDRCSEVKGVLPYHSRVGRQDESGDSRFKVGIEVEKEDEDVVHNTKTREVLETTGWVIERDASLDNEIGFELISPIYPFDIPEIERRIEPITRLLNAKTSIRCGGHIHVSDTERTPEEILLDIRGYLPLLYGLYPSRAKREYSEAKEVDSYLSNGHRQAISITPNTLEFRIFPAVRDKNQLLFRLSLVEYMLKNKETDVIKVGELLLDKNSELYKLLSRRISDVRLRVKAEALVDYANYIDRDALVLKGNKIRRVIKVPKIKEEKQKLLEEKVREIAEEKRERAREYEAICTRRQPISKGMYGYFADLVDVTNVNEEPVRVLISEDGVFYFNREE